MKNTQKISGPIIVSCFLAGMLETYDFMIFGLLATTIHQKYLSFAGYGSSLFISYALFSVGFLCRPLGALIFGYIGDKKGRKKALVTSVSMMGLASLVMVLLPAYESIGIISCYLIALVRVVQGLSLGGEFTGGLCYIIEHTDKKRSGLAGSIVVAGCSSGMLLSTIISNIVKLPSMPEYAWRFAFLLGFLLSIVGFFIRKKIRETPEFEKVNNSQNKIPLIEGLKASPLECITTILIGATCGTNIYYAIVYIPGYLKTLVNIDLSYLPTITTLIMASLAPLFGFLSDKISRGRLIATAALSSSIYALIMLPLILKTQTEFGICIIIGIHSFIFSIQNGTMNVFAVEIFPAEYRYSCAALCFSLGVGIIGGTSPMIAALIVEIFEDPIMILGLYVGIISFLAAIFIFFVTLKKENCTNPKNYQCFLPVFRYKVNKILGLKIRNYDHYTLHHHIDKGI